jgi:hypothetical protein
MSYAFAGPIPGDQARPFSLSTHNPFGKMQVAGGFFQIVMPQQQLNRAQVGTGFEQVGCETMAQREYRAWLISARS